ncbi:MAG: Hint domain [Rhodobacteraceae bacterium HLUCCO07]|nr:MAG: Hint domain [Rhodobacteraceae bacterium HLUCCO07]
MALASELPVDTSVTALDMADEMFGNGINVVSATYTGAASASGVYTAGDSVAPGVTPSDTGVILSTGKAADITNSDGDANTSSGTSTDHMQAGDSDLSSVSGQTTYDAAIFEADFIPQGSELTMQVVFSSEEYLEYVNSGFNDAVGVWVNGEQAVLTVGSGDITINNINNQSNENLYIDNPASGETYNTEMDGFTVTLTLKAPVNPNEVNAIKIGIADGGDGAFDSNLLIAGDSIQTALVARDDNVELRTGDSDEFDVLANDTSSTGSTLTITEINGQPVSVGDTVVLTTGEAITLTSGGLNLATADNDMEESTFSYTVEDEAGNSDVAFVNLTTVPCFTAGTLIETPVGPVRIETLEPGDLVLTLDHGSQPVRWIGQTRRRAEDRDAPVTFEAGALGTHAALELSPNHRILIRSALAELLFGAHEILVKARELVNDETIRRRRDGQPVTYIHLLFDRHELICGNGLWSESYHPGRETAHSFDAETGEEIRRLFPELCRPPAIGYGPTARMTLKSFEARLMLA